MNPHSTQWLPGILAVAAALLAAVVFALLSRRKHPPVAPPSSLEDLQTRYQSMLAQLKEHAANKHLHPPEAWAAEQARLEQEAADVLRERAREKHEALKTEARAQKVGAPAEAMGFFAKNPAIKGAIWGAGVVGFFVLLGIVLSQESKDRRDGQEATGTVPPGAAAAAPPEDTELKAALERANRSPDDIDALSNAAKELISRQMFEDAAPLVQRATSIDPYHVRTRIHRSVLLALEGQTVIALDQLVHLADSYGAYEARLFAGMLAVQANDRLRAVKQFEQYMVEAPIHEQPPMLGRGIAQLKAEAAAQPAAGLAPVP